MIVHRNARGVKWPDLLKNPCDGEPVAYAAFLSRAFRKKWVLL
jgi:hypothetical protein